MDRWLSRQNLDEQIKQIKDLKTVILIIKEAIESNMAGYYPSLFLFFIFKNEH